MRFFKTDFIKRFIFILIVLWGGMNLVFYSKLKTPSFGFQNYKIREISGIVVQDSVISGFGMKRVFIRLSSIKDHDGNASSAKGLMSINYNGENLYVGDIVSFNGKLDESCNFKGKLSHTEKRGAASTLRIVFFEKLSKRLEMREEENLIRTLLLGFSSEYGNEIVENARKSGVSHVLALSGMHLSFFSTLLYLLFYPVMRKEGKYISYFFLVLYVYFVGQKPSLIRALIFRFIFIPGMNPVLSLIFTFFIHAICFGQTIFELSSIYSYSALFGILLFSPFIKNLNRGLKFFAFCFLVPYFALIFTIPVSLYCFGTAYLSGLFLSFGVTILIYLIMFFSLLVMINPCFKTGFIFVYKLFIRILELGNEKFRITNYKGYVIFLIPLLFIVLSFVILKTGRGCDVGSELRKSEGN